MEAAELVFVDRIDVAAEALRSPAEIGRMLTEAEGRVGALTEVIGGTCVVANLCPAKFRLYRLCRQRSGSRQALSNRAEDGVGQGTRSLVHSREAIS